MTMEQILADIRSDRIKKVIHDADMGIEMDDQYALAFCLGASDKLQLLSYTPPENYIGVICRVDSKFCPIKINMNERIELRKHAKKYDKNNNTRAEYWDKFLNLTFEII